MSTPKGKVSAETTNAVVAVFAALTTDLQAEFDAVKKEQEAAWKKEFARMKEEDLYQFNKEKRDREDELEEELKDRKKVIEEREANVEARELAVDASEAELKEYKAKVEAQPAELAKAESTGFNKGKAEAKKEADNELKLKEAEWNADKRVFEAKVSTLEGTIATHEATIKALQEQLAAANSRVETIATSAVTAAGQSKVTVQTATTGK